jgi:hypothetical protein
MTIAQYLGCRFCATPFHKVITQPIPAFIGLAALLADLAQ